MGWPLTIIGVPTVCTKNSILEWQERILQAWKLHLFCSIEKHQLGFGVSPSYSPHFQVRLVTYYMSHAVASLEWVPWVLRNLSIFEQGIPESIIFWKKGQKHNNVSVENKRNCFCDLGVVSKVNPSIQILNGATAMYKVLKNNVKELWNTPILCLCMLNRFLHKYDLAGGW